MAGGRDTVLVFGAKGQLGHRLIGAAERLGIPVTGLARNECDFLQAGEKDFVQLVKKHRPSIVINAAAYTAVDTAETETDKALRINATVPAQLARVAASHGATFVHFSTDYVFDGERGAPYTEESRPNPINRYGETKLAGEEAVMAANPASIIFRLQFIYDTRGKSFFRTMMGLLAQREYLQVVADQWIAPGFAPHLADAVMRAAQKKIPSDIYHMAAAGHASRHGFTCAIRDGMLARGMPCIAQTIEPIVSEEYSLPAPRPKDTRLNCEKLEAQGITLPHWQAGLAAAMDELKRGADAAA